MMQASMTGQPRATDRGLALVSVVADHPQGLTLADAARAVGLSASTALRQLRSLESSGFSDRRADGMYVPGPELIRIARHLTATSLPQRAQPILVALTIETGESSYIAESLDRRTATYVAMAPSVRAVRHVSWLGQHVARRGTAVGAALAGRVDEDGAVSVCGAVEDGVTAVSAPVRGPDGAIIGAVSVVGPSFRLRGRRLSEARNAVTAAARQLGSPHPTTAATQELRQ